MKIGMHLPYAQGGFASTIDNLVEFQRAGLDAVSVAELYSFDAVSQLGFIAARCPELEIASGILQIYTRTPALTAMTAAGLDYVSGGRFTLGIGASGPQVIEGFHGVRYDAPLGRTREIIEICRQVWRRDRLEHHGKYYEIPLPADQGTGLGKPLKLINHPVRVDIPIQLAALGPKNVALAAELAEVWEPIFFHVSKARDVWGASLDEGAALRSPGLPPMGIAVPISVAIGSGADEFREATRNELALYIGGMGAKDQNFYAQLATRYGYGEAASEIQDLYLAGAKAEAAAKVPDELIDGVSLIGSETEVSAKLGLLEAFGVTKLDVKLLEPGREKQLQTLKILKELLP